MIRYLLHRLRRHEVNATRDGFLHFYHCWTCSRNWDGVLLRGDQRTA